MLPWRTTLPLCLLCYEYIIILIGHNLICSCTSCHGVVTQECCQYLGLHSYVHNDFFEHRKEHAYTLNQTGVTNTCSVWDTWSLFWYWPSLCIDPDWDTTIPSTIHLIVYKWTLEKGNTSLFPRKQVHLVNCLSTLLQWFPLLACMFPTYLEDDGCSVAAVGPAYRLRVNKHHIHSSGKPIF